MVRILEGVCGNVEITLRWVVRFAYADSVPWVRRMRKHGKEYLLALAGPQGGHAARRPAAACGCRTSGRTRPGSRSARASGWRG